MWADVVAFHEFYESPLGRTVRRVLRAHLEEICPDVSGEVIAGYGYALPYLASFHQEADRVIGLMPAPMGAMPWPDQNNNRVVLCENTSFPLPDGSVNRFLVIHGMEYTEHMRALLREVWRVLADGGQLILVTPNRRGVWARRPNNPLGHGHPFTGGQVFQLLENNLFTPEKPYYCLFTPPTLKRSILNLTDTFERYGKKWFDKFGGLVVIQAQKQVLAPVRKEPKSWRRRIFIPSPAAP